MNKRTTSRAQAQAIRLIQSSDCIYIGTHVRPDGDALGSLLALALGLEAQGRRAARLCADPVPDNYRFLAGTGSVCSDPPEWRAQLGIVLDCDGRSRLGKLEPAFANLPQLLDIDHHATDQAFGEVRLIDPRAAATAELVYHLLGALGVPCSRDIATCLYAAILTDTGRFCYGNTTAKSLDLAAELVGAGADPYDTARHIYEGRSVAAVHLLGLALSRLDANQDSQVVSATLTRRDFLETGAASADTEGIIDHLRAIGGPRVALLFVEMENGEVRVSMRSDGSVDVSRVALDFGGGGHMMAAGCTVPGKVDEVRARVVAAVRRSLGASHPANGS